MQLSAGCLGQSRHDQILISFLVLVTEHRQHGKPRRGPLKAVWLLGVGQSGQHQLRLRVDFGLAKTRHYRGTEQEGLARADLRA